MAIRFVAFLAIAIAACGDAANPMTPPPPSPPTVPPPIPLPPNPVPPPPPPCETDEFVYVAWVLDGESGEYCSPDPVYRGEIDNCTASSCPPVSAAVFSFHLGAYPQCFLPAPYAETMLRVYNSELRTGAMGNLQAEDGRAERVYPLAKANDSPPYGEVYLSFNYSGPGECGPAPVEFTFSTSGTWNVIRGGWLGDTVEVEARDVTFGPTAGHDFRFTRMYWRVRLPDPAPPEPPRPRDGGI